MSVRPLSELDEFGLIEDIQRQFKASKGVIKGIGDDTAVLNTGKEKQLLLTTDMLVEGVHFSSQTPARCIGHKALACNISDIAAMGGVPKYAVVSIGVPIKMSPAFVRKIYQGIKALAKKYRISVVGGDTVKSNKLVVNICLTGEVKKGRFVSRSGAKAGDWILVTGPLGNSLRSGHHLKFEPRLAESRYVVKRVRPHAMIDISDGLAADLGHILKQSNVSAEIDQDVLPLRKGASLNQALSEGEDFELLVIANPSDAEKLLTNNKGFTFFPIGRIIKGTAKLYLVNLNGKKQQISMKGFQHF